jgi:hypothetical protein
VRKGPPIVWEGSLGPDSFEEPIEQFSLESKSDFTRERPLRSYDNARKIGQNAATLRIMSCRCTTTLTAKAVVSSDAREDLYFLLTLIFSDLHLVCRSTYWFIGRCVFRIQAA